MIPAPVTIVGTTTCITVCTIAATIGVVGISTRCTDIDVGHDDR